MKFKVLIHKMETKSLKGWMFSILNPNTGDPIYEFYHPFQKLGKDICEEIISQINEGIGENEK